MTESQEERSRRLDDEAAALTDALLRGETPAVSEESQSVLDVALRLDALIAPRTPPSTAFERQLRTEVEAAWIARSPRRTSHLVRNAVIWTLAAAAVLLIAFVAIPDSATFPLSLSGSATSTDTGWVQVPWRAVIFVLGFGGLAVYWIYRLRR